MKQVLITLEFENEEITRKDVVEYLKALIEDGSLDYEVVAPLEGRWM